MTHKNREKYLKYQKDYYTKNKKKKVKILTQEEINKIEYYKKLKRQNYYRDYNESKKYINDKPIEKTLTLMI